MFWSQNEFNFNSDKERPSTSHIYKTPVLFPIDEKRVSKQPLCNQKMRQRIILRFPNSRIVSCSEQRNDYMY